MKMYRTTMMTSQEIWIVQSFPEEKISDTKFRAR